MALDAIGGRQPPRSLRPAPDAGSLPQPMSLSQSPSSPERLWRALAAFARREAAVRYRQALLGGLWALAQPVALTAAAVLFVRGIVAPGSDPMPYLLLAGSGLVVWTWFQTVVLAATPSLVNSSNLVRKMAFPYAACPLGTLLALCIDLAIGLALLLVVAGSFGPGLDLSLLWAFVAIDLLLMTAAATVLVTSTLNVYWRDVKHTLPLLLQAGLFLTPVLYRIEDLPAGLAPWLLANPLVPPIRLLRVALGIAPWPEWGTLVPGLASLALLCLIALILYRRLAPRFADVI